MIFYSSIDFKPFFPSGKGGLNRDRDETGASDREALNTVGDFLGTLTEGEKIFA
jgi:hypothetical protein